MPSPLTILMCIPELTIRLKHIIVPKCAIPLNLQLSSLSPREPLLNGLFALRFRTYLLTLEQLLSVSCFPENIFCWNKRLEQFTARSQTDPTDFQTVYVGRSRPQGILIWWSANCSNCAVHKNILCCITIHICTEDHLAKHLWEVVDVSRSVCLRLKPLQL